LSCARAIGVIAAAAGLGWCAVLLSCGSPNDPCDDCSGDRFCVRGVCVAPCSADSDCDAGHACVDEDDVSYCDPMCSDELCEVLGPRYACQPDCVMVECADSVPCEDPTSICDAARRCLPRTGACSATIPCPSLARSIRAIAGVTCDETEGVCRLARISTSSTPLSPGAEPIALSWPTSDRLFSSESDVVFTWSSEADTHFVLVTRGLPSSAEELRARAIWGAVATGDDRSVRWSEGRQIENGDWLPSLAPAPRDEPLHVLVQAVREHTVTAISAPEVFAVGDSAPWFTAYAACGANESCGSPLEALVCVGATCRRACTSHVDCVVAGETACGDPVAGLRVCE
jgi:hypothetical protein